MAEVMPRVTFARELGDMFEDISIDFDALEEYMLSQNIEAEKIENTRIHFSAKDSTFIGPDGIEKRVDGVYDIVTGVITIYPRAAYDVMADNLLQTEPDQIEYIRQIRNAKLMQVFSRTILHELTHQKENPVENIEAGDTRCIVDEVIKDLYNNFDKYKEDPEEALCRSSADNGPQNIVLFDLKVPEILELAA